jgi:predicted GNAT family acetyltransferase
MSEDRIELDRDARRFTVKVDGQVGVLDFDQNDGVMAINSVRVPEAIGGRGIAGRLTRRALDQARAEGLSVDPACPYARRWIEKHPDYQDLVASQA